MAEIFPFAAYRYNLDRVNLPDVITQPYDKITPSMQQRYLQNSPYNLIAVEKGQPTPADSPSDNVYTRAEQALTAWIRDGILLRDSAPGIYVYSQEYTVPGSAERRTRQGFIALGRVEDYAAGVVFRHEQTLAGPKVDRLELLRHTRTHTGQLFMLYADPERRVDILLAAAARSVTPVEARDEYGVLHRLWPIFDPLVISGVVREMASQKLVIADGHHRYETALAYRDECRAKSGRSNPNAPYEKSMMTLFNTHGEGLLILPTHRVVANLDAHSTPRRSAATYQGRSTPSPTLSAAARRAPLPMHNFDAPSPPAAARDAPSACMRPAFSHSSRSVPASTSPRNCPTCPRRSAASTWFYSIACCSKKGWGSLRRR